ncbi:hypothetical protein MANES_06G068850v8 [Manihot esculenta]|uniref:Uncharacterized protein n=1 Tax=Manihot esculenta TaxID=3983 RepID=A0ACB7HJD4_MANES|nr:hypothetical protein MANES_06G068850v8 [Manihot esculenta]
MAKRENNSKESITMEATNKSQITTQNLGDPLTLQSSDHLGMILDSPRSQAEIGIHRGIIFVPDKGSDSYEQWKRYDFMVMSWILYSISKELVDGFIYTASARDLWLKIIERFSEYNGTMIYELHELGSMETLPSCTCGASKAIDEINNRNKLMQFLIGLSDAYGAVRDQILGMDQLLSINKAYSMVLKFESQKEILGTMSGNVEPLVLLNRTQGQYQGR